MSFAVATIGTLALCTKDHIGTFVTHFSDCSVALWRSALARDVTPGPLIPFSFSLYLINMSCVIKCISITDLGAKNVFCILRHQSFACNNINNTQRGERYQGYIRIR